LTISSVVYTIVRSSTGNSKNGTKSSQARSQVATIAGYRSPQVSVNSAKRAVAASTVGAV
jgi:hypothetical protein